MAHIRKGILGGFSGLVGTVVGSSWNGIDYMRSRPARGKERTFSQAQLDQQQKFALAAGFTQTLGSLTDLTFQQYAVRKTGRNSAISYLLNNAITGSSPSFALDYSKVLVSRGNLNTAPDTAAAAGPAGRINFSWTNNGGDDKAKNNDRVLVVVHCPALKRSVYSITTATRIDGTCAIDVPAFTGQTVHTWMGFISDDYKLVANSAYTGSLVVS